MRVTRKRNISTNQNKSITDKTNTTLRSKTFIDYEDKYIRPYHRNDVITKKRTTDVYVQKNDRNRTKL